MPLLGKAVRHEWPLDWDFLTVNHGSFGAAPRVVLAAQRDWQQRMEAQPSRFMRTVLPDALRHAAERLGGFIGADGNDIGFVDNATTGCNAVLRSLRLQPDDEIVVLSHGYGAVRNTVRHVCERAGARVVVAQVPFPTSERRYYRGEYRRGADFAHAIGGGRSYHVWQCAGTASATYRRGVS